MYTQVEDHVVDDGEHVVVEGYLAYYPYPRKCGTYYLTLKTNSVYGVGDRVRFGYRWHRGSFMFYLQHMKGPAHRTGLFSEYGKRTKTVRVQVAGCHDIHRTFPAGFHSVVVKLTPWSHGCIVTPTTPLVPRTQAKPVPPRVHRPPRPLKLNRRIKYRSREVSPTDIERAELCVRVLGRFIANNPAYVLTTDCMQDGMFRSLKIIKVGVAPSEA